MTKGMFSHVVAQIIIRHVFIQNLIGLPLNEPRHEKTFPLIYAPNEDSYQNVHLMCPRSPYE